jgi:hypothetical protein
MRDPRAVVAVCWTVVFAACSAAAPQFDAAESISAATGVGAAPMFAVAADGREAIAWVSAAEGGSDGVLHVRVGDIVREMRDSLGPIEPHGEAPPKLAWAADGSLHALWVVGRVVPGRRFPVSALRHARSTDGGNTWNAPVTVTDDTLVFGSHNFHALHTAADGGIIAAWLDGRDGQSAAFLARSDDGGVTWGKNIRISMGEACPCCRTAIASAPDGSVWVAWRTVLEGDVRDIVVARSRDGGRTFGEAKRVYADDWVFPGCPHAGPSLIADAQGRVHIAWWTGKEGRAAAWYARADDGETFGTPQALSVIGTPRPVHVQLAVHGDTVLAAWDDDAGAGPQIFARLSYNGGTTFARATALSEAGQVASFPVVGLSLGRATIAWTQKTAEQHRHEERARPDMRAPNAVMGLPEVGQAAVLVRHATWR